MNPQQQQEINQIEVSLEEAKKIAEFGRHIAALENNRAFQAVVFEGYFRTEASRLTMLLSEHGNPNISREETIAALTGIAHFRSYLQTKRKFAEMAAREVEEHTALLEEMHDQDGSEAGHE